MCMARKSVARLVRCRPATCLEYSEGRFLCLRHNGNESGGDEGARHTTTWGRQCSVLSILVFTIL